MKIIDINRYWLPLAFLAVLLLAVLFFRATLWPGMVLFHTDDNIGMHVMIKAHLPAAFLGFWEDTILLGVKQMFPWTLKNVLLWALSAVNLTNWIHAIYLAGASIFLLLFFRARGLRLASALVGVLTAFWLASNFTLVYPGHLGKFGVLMFAAAGLWCAARAVQDRRNAVCWAALAGGALGQMFIEQQDLALFFACVLGPYILFALWSDRGWDFNTAPRVLVPMLLLAALLAVPSVWVGYRSAVRGVASMERENPKEKWDFCTQWSWPPEESIDFIAPGFMGWRSGEPAGPYWGRMGRSPGWEETKQGFQNLKLENQYLGAIPLALAVFAALAALVAWRRQREAPASAPIPDPAARREIFFWTAAALVTLLLAFGKYFQVYYLFYQLPGISSIRNPNKFLQVFQLALAILAAYGFEIVIKSVPQNAAEPKGKEKELNARGAAEAQGRNRK
jgi:hypothetical protein